MKGIVVLTMGRSGSTWLGRISNNTGVMGNNEEWLGFEHLEHPLFRYSANRYYDEIMRHARSNNQRFSIKIFPRHLRQSQDRFGFDFIRKCMAAHEVKIVLLHRQDRLGQAVSLVRARQTGKWNSGSNTGKARRNIRAEYDFRSLCQAYFHIGRGYDFWRSYLGVHGLAAQKFTYEALMQDPSSYFEAMATHLQVPPPETYETGITIQRDATSAAWRARFSEDFARDGLHPDALRPPQPDPGIGNAVRLLLGWRAKMRYTDLQS